MTPFILYNIKIYYFIFSTGIFLILNYLLLMVVAYDDNPQYQNQRKFYLTNNNTTIHYLYKIKYIYLYFFYYDGFLGHAYRANNHQTRRQSDNWDNNLRKSLINRHDTEELLNPSKVQYTKLIPVRTIEAKRDPLMTISETLGALNTVGSYIVNMTRGGENSSNPSKELPSAIYTISKNILGRNVTDSIAPLVRGVKLSTKPTTTTTSTTPLPLPFTLTSESSRIDDNNELNTVRDKDSGSSSSSSCTTSDGGNGKCQDLSNCPQLLLDLTKLRQSLCFKSLFVPGVCCPIDKPESTTYPR